MAEEKRGRGRPSLYTEELGLAICRQIAAGKSLRAICEAEGMPDESTVRAWAIEDVGGFYPHYARAREIQAEKWADEIIEISDDSSGDIGTDEDGNEIVNHDVVQRSRLRVDTRKWVLSKVLPKKYGESTTIKGDKDNPLTVQALATALDASMQRRLTHKPSDEDA